jgi:UDP-3-O-acyl-N-acetylglucosamine deacetylase
MKPTDSHRQTSGGHINIVNIAQQTNVSIVVSTIFPMLNRLGVIEHLISERLSLYIGNIIVGLNPNEIPMNVKYSHPID